MAERPALAHASARRTRLVGLVVLLASATLTTLTVTEAPAPAEDPPAVTVDVDRTSAPVGTSALAVGTTHTQKSLEASFDRDAVARGRALLTDGVELQNQHIYGWGVSNPNPSPGVYNFGPLDRRIRLMRETGATPVITLCCAPDWMTSLADTTTSFIHRPPLATHYADFADLARRIALRYPDVTRFVVWNEMKGFWNPVAGQWDYVSYTAMYNAVYDALKAVNPAIQVGGPYLTIEATGSNIGGWVTGSPVTPRNRVMLTYWRNHAHGADFAAIDRKVKDYHDTNPYTMTQRFALAENFARVTEQVGEITGLPVWFIEDHFVGKAGGEFDVQGAGVATMIYHQLVGGARVSMGWEPEQDTPGGLVQEHLWTSTAAPGGGQPFPVYDVYRWFHHEFPPGTPLYAASSSDTTLLALANANRTLLINQSPWSKVVTVDGVAIDIAPYEVALLEPSGAKVPTMATWEWEGATSTAATREVDTAPIGSEPYVEPAAPTAPSERSIALAPDLTWLRQISTESADRAYDVAIADGSLYGAGNSYGRVGDDDRSGHSDAWVQQYDRDGAVLWSDQFGGPFNDAAIALAADHTGFYVGGTTDDSVAGQPNAGVFDGYVRRYGLNRKVRWTRQFGTATDDTVRSITLLDDVVYVGGTTDAPVFGGQTTMGYDDLYVMAFDLDGNHLWTKTYGTGGGESLSEITAGDGTLFVSGFTSEALPGQTSAGHWDAFVMRLGPDGTVEWTRQFGTPGDDRALGLVATDDAVYVGGQSEGALDGLPFQGAYDGFVRRYDLAGTLVWGQVVATPKDDHVQDVAVDLAGVHAFGRTSGQPEGQTHVGADDVFIADLDFDGTVLSMLQFGSRSDDDANAVTSDYARIGFAGFTEGTLPGQPPGQLVDGFVGERLDDDSLVLADQFDRSDQAGWGSAPYGGAYRLSRRAAFGVGGGVGRVSLLAGAPDVAAIASSAAAHDVRFETTFALDRLPVGGSTYVSAVARVAGTSEYRVRVRVQPSGLLSLRLLAKVGATSTPLTAEVPVGTVVAGQQLRLVAELVGATPTAISAAIAPADSPTPAWQVFAADVTPSLQVAGGLGLRAHVNGAGPTVAVLVDELLATRP